MSTHLFFLLLILSQPLLLQPTMATTTTSSTSINVLEQLKESPIFEDSSEEQQAQPQQQHQLPKEISTTTFASAPTSGSLPRVTTRHDSPPARKQLTDEQSSSSELSYDTASSCQPRESGYFGSTGGAPAVVEYGFELEASVFASMDQILTVIDTYVVNAILTSTFSDICPSSTSSGSMYTSTSSSSSSALAASSSSYYGGTGRRKTRTRKLSLAYKADPDAERVTGYKFSKEMVVQSMRCTPQLHQKNTCGYYSSQVQIFGYNLDGGRAVQDTLGQLRMAVPKSLSEAVKSGAVRLELVQQLTKQLSGPGMEGESSASQPIGAGEKAGLALALTVIVIGVGVLAVYCFIDLRQRRRYAGKKGRHGQRRMDFSRYFDNNSLTNTYQATESDESDISPRQGPSPDSSRQHSRSKSTGQKQERKRFWQQKEEVPVVPPEVPRPSVIVEFGPSFDPERDRFLKELEEESSAPPDYVLAMAMSSDFSLRDMVII